MQEVLKDIENIKAKQEQAEQNRLNKGIVEIEVKTEIKISEEDFKEYESCRVSGVTNMFDLSNVEMVTGLDRDKIKAIIKGYDNLIKLYPNVRKE